MQKVLITGASGLLGKRLTALLLAQGYGVNHLGRGARAFGTGVQAFTWNIENGHIEGGAFEEVTAIVHLAGANLADSRWTDKRKKELIDSRVKSSALIYKYLSSAPHTVNTYITASAVGYYGDCGAETVSEEHAAGKGFLSEICKAWEKAAVKTGKLSIREVRCRIGIVLAKEGGALPELMKTFAVGIAGYFAKPDLYYPWIHIDDVCGIIIHAIKNPQVQGAYNTAAPKPLLHKELMKEILEASRAKALLMPVPPLALKLAMGEMATMILEGQNTSTRKILGTGYVFKHPEIKEAVRDLLK